MAHNPRFKRENNLHTQNWMVENDEPLPTLWYTKMAHTHIHHLLHIDPQVWNLQGLFSWFNSSFKNDRFEQFFTNRGSQPKIRGRKKPFFTIGWLKMMSLCPHSGTLRWHTHSIYCIYKDPQMWNLEGLPLLVQFSFSKMLVLNNF